MAKLNYFILPAIFIAGLILISGCGKSIQNPEHPYSTKYLVITFDKGLKEKDILEFNARYNLKLKDGINTSTIDFNQGFFLFYQYDDAINTSQIASDPIVIKVENKTLYII